MGLFSKAQVVAFACGVGTVASVFGAVDLGNSTILTYTSGSESMSYRIFLPDGYSASGPALPVVLYLHSAAERGTDASAIFSIYNLNGDGQYADNPWIKPLIAETQHGAHKAILITPETGVYEYWNAVNNGDTWGVGNYVNATQPAITTNLQLAIDIVNQTLTTKNADANRVYVTGPSMGGYGTWDAITRFPNLFAAAAPLSGGGNVQAAGTTIANKPVWAFHGALDTLISVSNDDQLVNAMTAAGGDPIYSRVAGVGHGGWDTFYTPGSYTVDSPSVSGGSGADLYTWMFSQSLAPVPEPGSITLLAGAAAAALLRQRRSSFAQILVR